LVTFTPGVLTRGFKSSWRLFLEDSTYASHSFIPFTIRVGHERKGCYFGVVPSRNGQCPVSFWNQSSSSNPDSRAEASNGGLKRSSQKEGSNGDRCRKDLMNPVSELQGFLVASNPTDEGRIGTGRKPLKGTDESKRPS